MSFVSDKLYNDYIRPNMYRYVERIRATQVLSFISCLTDMDKEEINARNDMCGNHVAMQKFFDCLKRRRNWPSEFIKALKRLEQDDLASELEREYTRLINPQSGNTVPAPQQQTIPSVLVAPPAVAPPLHPSPLQSAPITQTSVYTYGNQSLPPPYSATQAPNNPAASPAAATPLQNLPEYLAQVLPSPSQSPLPPPSPVSNASVQTSLPANLPQGATSHSQDSHATSQSEPDGVPDPSSVPSSPEENSRRNQVELKTPVQETATRHTNYNAVPSVIGHPDSNSDTVRNQTDANYQLTGTPQESRISRSVYSSGRPSAGPGHPQVIPLIRGATAGYMKEEYLSKPGILRSTNIDDQPCSMSSSRLEISCSVTENLTMSGVRQVPENPIRGMPPSGAGDDSFLPHDTSASSPCLSAVHSSPFSSEEYKKDQKIQALQGYQNPNLMESFVDVNIPHMIQDQHDTFQKLAQSPETSGARGPLENGAGNGGEHSEGNKTSSTEPWHSHHSTSGRETTALYEMSDGASSFSDVRQNEMHYSQNPSIDDHAPNQLVDLREESPQSYHSWSDLERPDTSSQPRERENLRSVPLQSPENNQREPRGDASRQFDAYLVPAIAIAALSVVAALLWRYMKK
ncbi:hypothetical protein HHUSO_G3040 [Huso huso]|uniref:Caspase recruitment domain-containing protein n=1 Tax=Huso huso TaxID=61971 RepID=A0ABR1A8M5_HUSHU